MYQPSRGCASAAYNPTLAGSHRMRGWKVGKDRWPSGRAKRCAKTASVSNQTMLFRQPALVGVWVAGSREQGDILNKMWNFAEWLCILTYCCPPLTPVWSCNQSLISTWSIGGELQNHASGPSGWELQGCFECRCEQLVTLLSSFRGKKEV